MSDLPDQRQLWDAYGHAMGAISAVELLLRVALMNTAVAKMVAEGDSTDERKRADLAKIQGRTLGGTVAAFKKEFPMFGEDAAFCESIDNAVFCRNQLAHHFVENNLLAFRSNEGIALATLTCIEHLNHFQSLDRYLRQNCPVDYDAFFRIGEEIEGDFVDHHPLREKLRHLNQQPSSPPLLDQMPNQ